MKVVRRSDPQYSCMVQATDVQAPRAATPAEVPLRRRSQTSPGASSIADMTALVEALRDVVFTVRRKAPGSMHDKSVVALLAQLMQLGPTRATDLADLVGLDLSTISRHLRTLEADGHVARKPDPDDGRATLLAVTRSGQRVVRQAREQRIAMLAEALDNWSDADRAGLIRLTRQLADSLETV